MASIHHLVGPVGAGKSTFAQRRCASARAQFLDVDTWMVRLFAADARPAEGVLAWYVERRERVRDLLWDTACDAVRAGTDAYVELGLVTAHERDAWFAKAGAADLEMTVTLFDAPRDVRRERVARRNAAAAPYTQFVPPAFFEAASDAWQPVEADERARWRIVDA